MTLQNTTVNFVLFLETHYVACPEQMQIGIDENKIITLSMPQQTVEFQYDLAPGPHKIWVELCNKIPENESRDNGKLVDDTYVKIKNLSINGSMMNYLLNDNGYTVVDWDYHPDVADWFELNRGSVPDRIANSNYLNLKGTYYFDFDMPLKDYLDRHIEIDPTYKKYYNSSLERYRELKDKLTNS